MKNSYPTADFFSELCLAKFDQLPKAGKPRACEWTVLSCFIQHDDEKNESKVIALGAGTKCLSKSRLCSRGLLINDSHAEVLARRGFFRYVYEELLTNDGKVFVFDEIRKSFRLKKSITFHFFSTEVPCGDACIYENIDALPSKRAKIMYENVYTGAKLLNTNTDRAMSQVQGAIRTKPGRGETTLSVSCSDKLSKWYYLGVQGALLDSILFSPIYLETLNFGCVFNNESLERAIYKRWELKKFSKCRFHTKIPEIRAANKNSFVFKRCEDRSPSPNGSVWCELRNNFRSYEVCVNGRRQGVTAKNMKTKKAALQISKTMLMEKYCNLLDSQPQLLEKFNLKPGEAQLLTYAKLKAYAFEYQNSWKFLKNTVFLQWTEKPENLYNFALKSKNQLH